jgi:hypothetical protein
LYGDVLFNPVTAHVEISAASEWCELPNMHLVKLASFTCIWNFSKCCSEADSQGMHNWLWDVLSQLV